MESNLLHDFTSSNFFTRWLEIHTNAAKIVKKIDERNNHKFLTTFPILAKCNTNQP